MTTQTITLSQPDDWHVHFRDEHYLSETVAATARCFARAIVMPNLTPPIRNAEQAIAYRQRILQATPPASSFKPLMTLYLTDQATAKDIQSAQEAGVIAAKLYPAGATTNSDSAVTAIEALYPIFEALSDAGMRLLIHGEVTHNEVDIFDREAQFIDECLIPIQRHCPELKIVFEHITTRQAADFVLNGGENIAATITPQHLLLNRNDLLVGGIRPHNYCLPILKRSTHQERLREVAISGSKKFFLGTDSAPHSQTNKENACGCAGCYSAWSAIELYAEIFDELGALDKLEGFASHYGADFYGLERNTATISLIKEPWVIPASIALKNGENIVPFFAGKTVNWRLMR